MSSSIPSLQLKNDSDSLQAGNTAPYSISIDLLASSASNPWTKASLPFASTPVIQVKVPVGADAASLVSLTDAKNINIVADPNRITLYSKGESGSPQSYENLELDILALADGNLIGNAPGDQLKFDISAITVNSEIGTAQIIITPGIRDNSGTTTYSTPLHYSILKETSPFDVGNILWDSGDMGPGNLTWKTGGIISHCTIAANGEPLGKSKYLPPAAASKWSEKLILQSGYQRIAVTATDQAENSNTGTNDFSLSGEHGDFYALQPAYFDSNSDTFIDMTPVSLVQVDAASQINKLYAIFRDPSGTGGIYENKYSGTQANWEPTPLTTLPAGYETSPCALLGNGKFYLLNGSLSNPNQPQSGIYVYDTAAAQPSWQKLEPPSPALWPEPIMGQSVIVFNQEIWVIGGYGASGTVYKTVQNYNATTGWTTMCGLPVGLCMASPAIFNNTLYLFGGYSDAPLSTTQATLYAYSDNPDSWNALPVAFPTSPPPFNAAALDYWFLGSTKGKLYVFIYANGSSSTWYYSPSEWQNQDNAELSKVAISPLSSYPYGITSNPTTVTINGKHEEVLFFAMTVNDSSNTTDGAFAFYTPGGIGEECFAPDTP